MENMIVVYSTGPGQTASAGPTDGHSPFAQAFLDLVREGKAKNDVRTFLSALRSRTLAATGFAQEPVVYDPFDTGDEKPLAPR
jgi:hypothetical protein